MCRTIKTLLLILIGLVSLRLIAQPIQTPYFKNKQDSVSFASLDARLKTLLRSSVNEHKEEVDSLMRLHMKLKEKIAGYHYAYTPKYKTLDQLTIDEYKTISELSITNHRKIPALVYQMENLKKLELVKNSMKRIPKRLNRLQKLEWLAIYNNSTSKGIKLGKNSSIKELRIGSSKLPLTYVRFKALEKLNLSGSNLDKFPSLKGLNKLKDLNLAGNALVDIQTANFSEAIQLQNIELQGNKIERVPASFGQLAALKKLMLNYNAVKEIDPACGNLKSLEQLGLYKNKLTAIPDCLYELESLKEVDLYYNEIEKLDERVSNWKKMEVLYLSNNKLFSVPENLGDMTSLQELYLSNNRISALPKSISNLTNLKVFRANNNRLLEAPDYLLKLNNIENIDISNNTISTFDFGILEKPALKIVILKSNPWDESTKSKLSGRAEELKSKGVIVHLDAEPMAQSSETQN